MIIFYYDKTFSGLLCAVFDCYRYKLLPSQLLITGALAPLFYEQHHEVITFPAHALRVATALTKRLSKAQLQQINAIWLAEQDESDLLLLNYLYKIVGHAGGYSCNYADKDVLALFKLAKRVAKESEHVRQFVRFTKTQDGVYFAPIAPRYNVLPLVTHFFYDRFADQPWALYDETRQYGYCYQPTKANGAIEFFTLAEPESFLRNHKVNPDYLADGEQQFQQLWQNYYQALTIKERINPTLQRQFMPTRFWRYLPEIRL